MVQYRRIIINNYTEEEHESAVLNSAADILWNDIEGATISLESCGDAGLFCVARFDGHEVEIDVYDHRGAEKYTD